MLDLMSLNDRIIADDLWNLVAGPLIGEGQYRKVFECRLDPTLVLKFEQHEGCHHNILEWENWQDLRSAKDWSKWLAPVEAISKNGRFLLMKRTKPIAFEDMPDKVPAFLTDRKVGNYGRLNGRMVCHDYSWLVTQHSLRLTKGKWWKE